MVVTFIKTVENFQKIEKIEWKIRSLLQNSIEKKINKSQREINSKLKTIKIKNSHRKRSFKDENIHGEDVYRDIANM